MRFGVMDMQIGALVPPGLTAANAAGHLAGFDHAAHVRRLAEQGFKLIELGGDLALFFPQAYAPDTIERLAALKAELGLSFTVHLPLWSLEPASPLPTVREGAVAALVQVLKATLPLEPEVYVLHSTGPLAAEFSQMALPEVARGLVLRQFFLTNAAASVQSILSQTGLAPRRLAVETIEFPFELLLELAQRLGVSICLDTGHVLAGFTGQVAIFDALDAVLPRLAEIHLHDAPQHKPPAPLGYGSDHQALGRGDLPVGPLLDRLAAARWDGPIIFELTIEEALASLATVRRLRPEMVAAGRNPPA